MSCSSGEPKVALQPKAPRRRRGERVREHVRNDAATALPEEVVALYGEAAVFTPVVDARKEVKLDLTLARPESSVREAVVTPFDDDTWYEPKRVAVKDSTVVVDADPKQQLLVVLDLGDTARNN